MTSSVQPRRSDWHTTGRRCPGTGHAERGSDEQSVALSIASGDVDRDGQDEILRTWPDKFGTNKMYCAILSWTDVQRNNLFYRELQVIHLPVNAGKAEVAGRTDGEHLIAGRGANYLRGTPPRDRALGRTWIACRRMTSTGTRGTNSCGTWGQTGTAC